MLVPKANVEAAKQANVVIEHAIVVVNDSVVLEGFLTKDTMEKSPSEIFRKLMEDLESMIRKASLFGEGSSKAEVDQTVSNYSLAPESNSWSLVSGQSSPPTSPRKVQNTSNDCNDCISPNGFQALQDICEEGEIEEDEEIEEVEVADSASLNVGSLPVVVVTNEKTSVTACHFAFGDHTSFGDLGWCASELSQFVSGHFLETGWALMGVQNPPPTVRLCASGL
ncbi:hypothetical protein F2Q70_00016128 [Brassica cretica]|uniref:Uncharacterized protein n=1 Tax=Brassica cretica TaxID=69181 RepID=A0A8S9I109_BRACR|nr:hypothetical protein F2Q70_00016128 [Brassica cretica]